MIIFRRFLDPSSKRVQLRSLLEETSTQPFMFPGAISPLSALLIEKKKFPGVYVSGSVLSNWKGIPDLGLTSITEVATLAGEIAQATSIPTIVDGDTGFGSVLNVERMIASFIERGLSGCHMEDQELPKKCGHLDGKNLVSTKEMCQKLKAARRTRDSLDSKFVLIARTDALANEGEEKTVDRAKAYLDVGADMIFLEAPKDRDQIFRCADRIYAPLLINLTEFGKTPLLKISELQHPLIKIVIYPVTFLRLAMKAIEEGLDALYKFETQASLVPRMQTRKELYELTSYDEYIKEDRELSKN